MKGPLRIGPKTRRKGRRARPLSPGLPSTSLATRSLASIVHSGSSSRCSESREKEGSRG
jgi:hypothetical protein